MLLENRLRTFIRSLHGCWLPQFKPGQRQMSFPAREKRARKRKRRDEGGSSKERGTRDERREETRTIFHIITSRVERESHTSSKQCYTGKVFTFCFFSVQWQLQDHLFVRLDLRMVRDRPEI